MLLCKLLFRGRKLYALKIIVCSRSKKIQAENSNSYFTAIKTILHFDFLFAFIFQIFEFSGMFRNIFQNSLHCYKKATFFFLRHCKQEIQNDDVNVVCWRKTSHANKTNHFYASPWHSFFLLCCFYIRVFFVESKYLAFVCILLRH